MTSNLRRCSAARSRHWSRHFAKAALTFLLSKNSSKHKLTQGSPELWQSARPVNRRRCLATNEHKSSDWQSQERTNVVSCSRGQVRTQRITPSRRLEPVRNSGSTPRCSLRHIITSRARKDYSGISKRSPTAHRCRLCSTTSRAVAAWISCRRPSSVWPKNVATSSPSKKRAAASSGLASCVGAYRKRLQF